MGNFEYMWSLKKYITFLFYVVPCMLFSQSLPKPILSHNAGYYSDSIILNITSSVSGAQIRYTLNGAEPTINSTIYSGQFAIKNRTHFKNGISAIPTNPSFNYPKPGYDLSRADTRGWLEPLGTVFKATVVKAKLFKAGYKSDSTAVASYLICEGTVNMFSLPVLSISLDSASLFSYDSGIYVYGLDSINEGNYSNDTAHRKAYVEFFETNGLQALAQYANIKIH